MRKMFRPGEYNNNNNDDETQVIEFTNDNTVTFVFKTFGEDGQPLSNNRGSPNEYPVPLFVNYYNTKVIEKQLRLSISCILLNQVKQTVPMDPTVRYGYVISHDYERFGRNGSLADYLVNNKVIPDEILYLTQQGRCKLYYDTMFEGHVEPYDFDYFYVAIARLRIRPEDFVYITASQNAINIHNEYVRAKGIHHPMQVDSIKLFELSMLAHLEYNNFIEHDTPVFKKFICLNRISRPQRQMFACLVLNDIALREHCYYSLNEIHYDDQSISFKRRIMYPLQCYPGLNITDSMIDYVQSVVPLRLDPTPHCTLDQQHSPIDEYYRTSLFNIVTETQFFDSVEYGLPTLFLTEKTFKPFFYRQIPIMLGGPQLIKTLRDRGFDVFDDIVDHKYDSIFDHEQRMLAVLAEVKRLNDKYTIEDCCKLKLELQQRFEHNYQRLRTYDPAIQTTL